MTKWKEILSLPVQNPPTSDFSSSDLAWSEVDGCHDTIDRVCLIPFARVDDFVKGESNNKECPTRFHKEAGWRRAPTTSCKSKVDGILEFTLYWCSFGPRYVLPNSGRPNTNKGCCCHFMVKRLNTEPSIVLIVYNHDKHIDKGGLPCHGPQDKIDVDNVRERLRSARAMARARARNDGASEK